MSDPNSDKCHIESWRMVRIAEVGFTRFGEVIVNPLGLAVVQGRVGVVSIPANKPSCSMTKEN